MEFGFKFVMYYWESYTVHILIKTGIKTGTKPDDTLMKKGKEGELATCVVIKKYIFIPYRRHQGAIDT